MSGSFKCGTASTDINDRLQHGKFRSIVTVAKNDKFADFNCADYDDDAACIQAAIDYATSHNITTLYIFGPEVYTISSVLTCSSNLAIKGIGFPVLDSSVLSSYFLTCEGTITKTVHGSANINIGDTALTVSDATGLNPHDLILIADNTNDWTHDGYPGWKIGEMHEVKSVSESIITFYDGSLHQYLVTDTINIQYISPITISITGITFKGQSATADYNLLQFRYTINSVVEDCIFDLGGTASIHIFSSYNTHIMRCNISNCEVEGLGYGIVVSNASAHTHIHQNNISACRHCTASGGSTAYPGQVRDYRVYNNVLYSSIRWAIDAHAITESMYCYENEIHNKFNFACVSGAKHTEFCNNHVSGGMGCGVRGYTRDMVYIVDNNNYENCGYIFLDYSAYSGSETSEKLVKVTNNTIDRIIAPLVDTINADTVIVENNSINSNVITGTDVITTLDNCSSATGWNHYTAAGGAVTSISSENGRVKVVGVTSSSGTLCIQKTFLVSTTGATFFVCDIESSISGYPRVSLLDYNSHGKTWDNNYKLFPNVNTRYMLSIFSPIGDIATFPRRIDTGFPVSSLPTLRSAIIGIVGATANSEIILYIDDLHVRSGYTYDDTGISVSSAVCGEISGNLIKNAYGSGITLLNCSDLVVERNVIKECNRANITGSALYESGIAIIGCTNIDANNNYISDTDNLMSYSIAEYATSDNNYIKTNKLSGAKTAQIYRIGSNTDITNNRGYKTENTGTATLLQNTTSITVTHGLAATPTNVTVTPKGNVGSCWWDTPTSTTFIIHCSTAPAADVDVNWTAIV